MERFAEIKMDSPIAGKKGEKAYRCPVCKDKGFYFKGDIAIPCACSRQEMLSIKREKAGITPRLAKQTFDRFDLSFYADDKRGQSRMTYRENAAATLKAAQGFVKEVAEGQKPDGLLLQGAVGSGKTYMAAACGNALIDCGIDVRFIVVPDFLDAIRDSFRDHSDQNEGELMYEVKTVPVLILDDLGAHNYTDWSIKTIFAILNYRLNYENPTIVTTNLERDKIEELLGSRVYSRLVEACRFFRLGNAKDIRMEQRIREIRKG